MALTDWHARDRRQALESPWHVGLVLLVAIVTVLAVVTQRGAEAQRRYQSVTLQLDVVSKRLAIPSTVDGETWLCAETPIEPPPCVQVAELRRHIGGYAGREK